METFIFPARTRTCYLPVRYLVTTPNTISRVTTVGYTRGNIMENERFQASTTRKIRTALFLGCYTASSCNFLAIFRDNLAVPIFKIILYVGADRLSRNFGKKLQLLVRNILVERSSERRKHRPKLWKVLTSWEKHSRGEIILKWNKEEVRMWIGFVWVEI